MNDLTPESAARFQRTQELLEQLNDVPLTSPEGRQRYHALASELLNVCGAELAMRRVRGDDPAQLAQLEHEAAVLRRTLDILAGLEVPA